MNVFDYYSQLSDDDCKGIQKTLEKIQDDEGKPGSLTVDARELSKLLAYFEQRFEGKQEDNS